MMFEMAQLDQAMRHRLLTSTIVPRPIAWITTLDLDGRLNAAPFSCFNLMGYSPPLVAIGLETPPHGGLKDSARNIASTQELVVNLVREHDAPAMVLTSITAPPEFDEAAYAGVTLTASTRVAPPRIATAPVSLECRLFQLIEPSEFQTIVLAEILAMHVDAAFVLDAERGHLDTPGLKLVGRMQGPGWYTRCGDVLQIAPPAPYGEAG
jgi:flavin reductase (DIM6/NTAB) family NADH-FMN oxidoreductase RutF